MFTATPHILRKQRTERRKFYPGYVFVQLTGLVTKS